MIKSEIAEILDKSTGVEAWSNVGYKIANDGRMFFRGTAYFRDVNKLKLHNQTTIKRLRLRRDLSDNLVLEAHSEKAAENKTEPKPKQLTEPELEKEVIELRAKFQQGRPMLGAVLGSMKHDIIINIPGPLKSNSNFRTNDGQLSLKFDGSKLLSAMDRFVTDDNLIRKQILSGKVLMQDGPADEDDLHGQLFGERGPVRAVIDKPMKPAFDYTVEVATAKNRFTAVRQELGLVTQRAMAIGGGELRNVKVVGTRYVGERTFPELRAFHQESGFTVAMQVEFSGAIVQLKGDVERAITDTDVDLVQKRTSHGFQFPSFSKDKTASILEFSMKNPDANANGFKEITGNIEYVTATGTRLVDLGFSSLREKSEGTELQSVIERIEQGSRGSRQISIQMRMEPDRLVAMRLLNAAGSEMILDRRGYHSAGGAGMYSILFECKGDIPDDGKLIVETYDQLTTYTVPFKLENLDLLGRQK